MEDLQFVLQALETMGESGKPYLTYWLALKTAELGLVALFIVFGMKFLAKIVLKTFDD